MLTRTAPDEAEVHFFTETSRGMGSSTVTVAQANERPPAREPLVHWSVNQAVETASAWSSSMTGVAAP